MQPPVRDYIQQFHKHNETGFRLIFEDYYKNLLVYAVRFVKDPNDREEIVLNAFLGLWRNLEHLEDNHIILPYLLSSVRNSCFKHLQKQQRINDGLKALAVEERFQRETAAHQKQVSDAFEEIMRLIKSLPELEQKVFLLIYVEGLSAQEIAQQLGIATQTVYNYKSTALDKLRKMVNKSHLSQDIKFMILFILLSR